MTDEWRACRKKPVVVHVRDAVPGEEVFTREGLTLAKDDDLVMRGIDGELYPIGRDLFARTYDLLDREESLPDERKLPPRWTGPVRRVSLDESVHADEWTDGEFTVGLWSDGDVVVSDQHDAVSVPAVVLHALLAVEAPPQPNVARALELLREIRWDSRLNECKRAIVDAISALGGEP